METNNKKINSKLVLRKDNKNFEIDKLWISPSNKVMFTIVDGKKKYEFDERTSKIFSGGREISPLYSYSFNQWNVMLPYLVYKEDEEAVKNYLKSVGVLMHDD